MGAQDISRRTDIALHFLAPVAKGMITSKIRLYGPKKAVIPYTIKEYKLTSVVLKIAEPLAPDQYYQLKFLQGLKSLDAPNGYEGSPYFTYGIAPEKRLSFMIDILGKIKAHIVEHERGTNPPPAEAYLITPALGQYYNLMQALLSKSWVTRDMKKKIDDALDIRS
ncbi:hypothetical protein PN36_24980 [Candidatus Thiomargarita nelsonii]|uniref:SbsA Ig-like domain-containing protein n=1 Tax=Candidatus Thiomargarita nelsonii TaxID=1003181 RepID=A0A0A6PRH2_9GAMM|nr:hypothetical protein PN36_24980 [Candidatus Thiomargarita nelsonii]